MNKDNAKDYLPLVQALAEGRVIQYKGRCSEKFEDVAELDINWPAYEYRIKPEPREIWVNRYKSGVESGHFGCRDEAKEFANPDHDVTQVCYREVLE